jgi:hypothetical protein
MPKEYGNSKTAHRRFQELRAFDFFQKTDQKLLEKYDYKVSLKKNLDR